MRLSHCVFATVAAIGLMTTGARASTIKLAISFSATDFFQGFGVPPPVDPVNGSFSVMFDPTKFYLDETSGISVKALNIGLGSPIAFSFEPSAGGGLGIGGSFLGAVGLDVGDEDDFYIEVSGITTTTPQGVDMTYVRQGVKGYWSAGSLSVSTSITQTPLPAALPLFASALAGLGFFGWRQRMRMLDRLSTDQTTTFLRH